ncbi:MAG TPA: exodeoxyribonuclease VII small subunit [Patescibacteria group bacterium]|nr:exodeoxyribonuclease VII small subunit [Patescibacteria group bacterium]
MANAKDIDYNTLKVELDNILQQLQSGDLEIDEAIKQYERGMALVSQLQTYLKKAENKVTKIKANLESKK